MTAGRALFLHRGRTTILATVLTVAAIVWTIMIASGPPTWIDTVDRSWLDLMVSSRVGPATVAALGLAAIGAWWFSVPLRAGVVVWLAVLQRWRDAAVFAATWGISWAVSATLKPAIDRPRPPAFTALRTLDTAAYPSGHTITMAATAAALVIVLAAPGRRAPWIVVAAAATTAMAWSRTYLGVHWLSDAIGGALIGVAIALDCAVAADLITRGAEPDGQTGIARIDGKKAGGSGVGG